MNYTLHCHLHEILRLFASTRSKNQPRELFCRFSQEKLCNKNMKMVLEFKKNTLYMNHYENAQLGPAISSVTCSEIH